MDQKMILATVWVTIWNSYCKKMYIDTVRNFTGEKYYFPALTYLRAKADGLGYTMKVGRKYISLVKKV